MTRIHAIEIDPKAGSAYVYFEAPTPGASTRQVNVGDAIIFDMGSDGRLVGIEILDPHLAAQFTGKQAADALQKSMIPLRLTA